MLRAGGCCLADNVLRLLFNAGAVPLRALAAVVSFGISVVRTSTSFPAAAAVAEDANLAAAADWVGPVLTSVKLARVVATRTRRLLPGNAHAVDGLALANLCGLLQQADAALQGVTTRGGPLPAVGTESGCRLAAVY